MSTLKFTQKCDCLLVLGMIIKNRVILGEKCDRYHISRIFGDLVEFLVRIFFWTIWGENVVIVGVSRIVRIFEHKKGQKYFSLKIRK